MSPYDENIDEKPLEETVVNDEPVQEEPVVDAHSAETSAAESNGSSGAGEGGVDETAGDEAGGISDKEAKAEQKRLEKEAKKKSKEDLKKDKKSKKKGKAEEGVVELDTVDTVIKHTDAQAHRYVDYYPPGKFSQTMIMTGVEMKRISKTNTYLAILLMGVIMYVLTAVPQVSERIVLISTMLSIDNAYLLGPNTAMAFCLAILPFFGAYYCSSKMVSTLPDEFKERTVYLNFALPVSKGAIYVGKFIANYLTIVLMILMGYGVAFLVAYHHYEADISALYVLKSLGVSLLTAFALSSMLYCMSANKKSGHVVRGLILIMVPATIIYTLLVLMDTEIIAYLELDLLEEVFDKVEMYYSYLPLFGFDYALDLFGGTGINFFSSDNALSLTFLPGIFGESLPFGDIELYIAMPVYFVWGMFFMLRGMRKFKRRQL